MRLRSDGLGVTVLLCALAFILFWRFVSLQAVYLFKDIASDSLNLYYPFLVHYGEYLRHIGPAGWSWQVGFGQFLFPSSPGAGGFATPYALPLLLVGRGAVPYLIVFSEIAKLVTAGLFFHWFLRELGASRLATYVGPLLLAFSGYIVVGSGWMGLPVEAAYGALMLLAAERWLRRGDWRLIPAVLALCAAFQPLFLYTHTVLLCGYVLTRSLTLEPFSLRAAAGRGFRLFGCFVLGTAMAAVFLAGTLKLYRESPRGGSASYVANLASGNPFELATPQDLATTIARLFDSNMLGVGSQFAGTRNYLEAPLLACGVLTLLLVPQGLVKAAPRTRRALLIVLGLCMLGFVFPKLRLAFWLFVGDYYRTYCLFVVFLLITIAMRGLDEPRRIHLPILAGTFLVLAGMLFAVSRLEAADAATVVRVFAFLLAETALLVMLERSPVRRERVRFALAAATALEVVTASWPTVHERVFVEREELRKGIGYRDESAQAAEWLRSVDPGFYRVGKLFGSSPAERKSLNDGMVQGFRGTTAYSSMTQASYVHFLGGAGVLDETDEHKTRWVDGLLGHQLLEMLGGVRYVMTRKSPAFPPGYTFLHAFGSVQVFRDELAFPFGTVFDTCLAQADADALVPPLRQRALLIALVVPNDRLASCPKVARPDALDLSSAALKMRVEEAKRHALTIEAFKENSLVGHIQTSQPALLFLAFPFDRWWTARVDGAAAPLEIVDWGLTGLALNAGAHRVELVYQRTPLGIALTVSLVACAAYLVILRSKRAS